MVTRRASPDVVVFILAAFSLFHSSRSLQVYQNRGDILRRGDSANLQKETEIICQISDTDVAAATPLTALPEVRSISGSSRSFCAAGWPA